MQILIIEFFLLTEYYSKYYSLNILYIYFIQILHDYIKICNLLATDT